MAENTYHGKPEHYDHLIEDGYEFHLGDYIKQGWNIFTQNGWAFFGFTILYMIISGITSQIPFVGIFVNAFVGTALLAGFFIVANQIHKGEKTDFGDFFKGFDDIKHLGISQILLLVINLVIMGVFGAYLFISTDLWQVVQGYESDPSIILDFITSPEILMSGSALLIPMVYISVAYMFTIPLIVIGRMEFWPAMETSRKIITRNFFNFLLLSIVMVMFTFIGVLFFGIGIFIAIAFCYCIVYAAYADIVGETNELENLVDEIGE